MNAAQLLSGNDYAHTDYLRRGVNYYRDANRLRVMRVYQEDPGYGETRKRTFVECLVIDKESGKIATRADGTEKTVTVRARDIFSRWDEYAIVHADKEKARLEQEAQYERERAERNRIYAERQAQYERERNERLERERIEAEEKLAKKRKRQTAVLEALEAKGISREIVTFDSNGYYIMINMPKLEESCGINQPEEVGVNAT